MAKKNKDLSAKASNTKIDGSGKKIGIIRAAWNPGITKSLENAAIATLIKNGVDKEDISSVEVPGTYELPLGAKILNKRDKFDALICIGCVIQGDTDHNKYISHSVAGALQTLNIVLEKPVIFCVLTPNTMTQAEERAGGSHGNKGDEAAMTALSMMALNDFKTKAKIGF